MFVCVCELRVRLPPRTTRTDTLCPDTTLFRSDDVSAVHVDIDIGDAHPVDQQRALAADELDGVAGEGFQVRDESALGFHHELVDLQIGRSEEDTSELQSLMRISYAVFCLNKQKQTHRPLAHRVQLLAHEL